MKYVLMIGQHPLWQKKRTWRELWGPGTQLCELASISRKLSFSELALSWSRIKVMTKAGRNKKKSVIIQTDKPSIKGCVWSLTWHGARQYSSLRQPEHLSAKLEYPTRVCNAKWEPKNHVVLRRVNFCKRLWTNPSKSWIRSRQSPFWTSGPSRSSMKREESLNLGYINRRYVSAIPAWYHEGFETGKKGQSHRAVADFFDWSTLGRHIPVGIWQLRPDFESGTVNVRSTVLKDMIMRETRDLRV